MNQASNKNPMDTREYSILEEILSCRDISGDMGRSKSSSIVDLIICPLGSFELIAFFWANIVQVGRYCHKISGTY